MPAVLGTETEFGITIRNQPDFNPIFASSLVINAYAGSSSRIPWSFDEESPGRDARGFFDPAPSAEFESGMVNVVLGNGARFYVDHAHPEYSTPECIDAREAALHDKAGEVVMARAVAAATMALPQDQTLFVHKNNSDGKGNSYGSHENYLVPRSVPFSDLVRHLTGFFVSRQIVAGAGKVGSENGRPPADFQITQRADFFEEEVGLETTLKRPIINTRDEPHADPTRYRRLHVIIGDANLSEIQTLIKLGVTSLMLGAIEAGSAGDPVILEDPVEAVWRISHDPTLAATVRLADGSQVTALDLQWHYFEWLSKHVDGHGAPEASRHALAEWEAVLTDLERDPALTADRLDWTAKLGLLEAYRGRHGLSWLHPRLRMLDLQYHDVDPSRSLYRVLLRRDDAAEGERTPSDLPRMRRLFGDAEVESAVANPPEGTRAWFRGRCVDKYRDQIVAANWDSLIFEAGGVSLRRVPMMDPLRGTRALTADLLDRSPLAADLIESIEADSRR